ncbi:L-aspartate oxidase [Brevundimonas sp.]|uniref:L-aspartate oxidase n=1 Tax=Brevundimonas sp. TaxID=1871086 RepID=UPI001D6BC0F8|nr:L-aspartate oxidase [Brevundimonas sp.]MBA4000250.1 L-aspartate oxidase [Brevundimonas sp.]
MSARRLHHDGPLIVGAGLAGLSAALAAAPRPVLVATPAPVGQAAASAWAQGGVAAALYPDDSAELHAADTVAAGAGLNDADATLALARAAPETIQRLFELGAPFDRDASGRFVQSLEAAHSRPRIVRAGGDGAGRAIVQALGAAALAAPHITLRSGLTLAALIQDADGRVRGAAFRQDDGALIEVLAPSVILATGGVGGLYAVTTNPAQLRGEGLGLAALAGAEILDPEFVQFHPTALDVGADPAPLATEALRGEGARLIDRDGAPVVEHPRGDLAPRDIVARSVHAAIAAGRGAFLDARQAIGPDFPEHFPAVFAAAMAAGIDPRVQPMPVAPAAHYHMGGIAAATDGRTSLPGLFAVGECAATGVHGANRLASNSLLEAAAFGWRCGLTARDEPHAPAAPLMPVFAPEALPPAALQHLRAAMSLHAGVVRDAAGLSALTDVIDGLEAAHGPAPALIAARLIARAALERRESRGGHFRADHPDAAAEARHTRITLSPSPVAMAAA